MTWTWEQLERALKNLATDDISRMAANHLIGGLKQDLERLSPQDQLNEVLSTAALIGSRVLATARPLQAVSSGSSLS